MSSAGDERILYCHCTYAKVVPEDVKAEVLAKLSASGVAFDAVADLCEMSARKDPALARLAATNGDDDGGDGSGCGALQIAACFPRAVKWLFHAGGAPLPETGVEIHNMREQTADEVIGALLGGNRPSASNGVPPSNVTPSNVEEAGGTAP